VILSGECVRRVVVQEIPVEYGIAEDTSSGRSIDRSCTCITQLQMSPTATCISSINNHYVTTVRDITLGKADSGL
jgi:hypothetical protein